MHYAASCVLLGALALLAVAAAQRPGPARQPESREASSYTGYEQPAPHYGAPPHGYPAPGYDKGPKYDFHDIFAEVQLPTVKDVVAGIVYVLAVASVAGIVLIGIFFFLKVLGLKLPIITDLKRQVLNKVDKVDARMIEDAWDLLQNAYDQYAQL